MPVSPVPILKESAEPRPVAHPALRVLHVLDHSAPLLSGYSVRSSNLVAAQRRMGLAPQVVTGPLHELEDSAEPESVIEGIRYWRTTLQERSRAVLKRRTPGVREAMVVNFLRNRILQVLDRESFDIVHAHSPALCGLAGLSAARARNLPFVYEIRAFWEDAAVDQNKTRPESLRYFLSQQLEGYVARRAGAVVGIARHILENLQHRGLARNRLFHVPNGVDAARFSPLPPDEQLRAQLGLGRCLTFGFIGSLYRYEGLAWLVRAAAKLRSRGLSFQVVVVGDGEDMAAVRETIRETGAEGYFRLAGRALHEQVQRYYSLMDIMVYPRRSVRLTELTTPLKPLEAMALGKAVLASDVGGLRELVGSEKPCVLFRPEDEDDFCRKAEELVTHESLRRELGERARQMVLHEKDWCVVAHRYQEVYGRARMELARSHRRG